MAFSFWTTDHLFNLNNIILFGWIALILIPLTRFSKCLVLLSALTLSVSYTIILLKTLVFRESNSTPSNLFHLSGWLALVKDPLMIISTTNHFCVMDLWVGQWMVHDFYSSYSLAYSVSFDSNGTYAVRKSWTIGRMIFTMILLITYLVAPFGFLVYHLLRLTFFKNCRIHERIDFEKHQTFNGKFNPNPLQNEPLNRRSVRFGDKLPESMRTIYHFILGIQGLILLFTVALPSYIALRIYCRIVYHPPSNRPTTDPQSTPNKLIPEYLRNVTSTMRLSSLATPHSGRNGVWYAKFLLLQLSTFIEYIPNAVRPIALFTSLEDYFTNVYNAPYYTFGDGIGVNSYRLVKKYLQDIPPRKSFESLGWEVSSSQRTFCDFTTTFLSSDDPEMKLGREIVFQWLHAFPYNLSAENCQARLHLSRLVPRKLDEKPDINTVYQAVGEVMFFLATGGELKKHEREAFIDCVKNPLIFFPNWFNYLLAGHYLERKNLNSYYTLLQAFSRYTDGPALRAAFKAAGKRKSQSEVLRLISIVFSIAGSAAPAKLAVTVIGRLWDERDREANIHFFKTNPHDFIKECARLDKVVPMVNVLATNEIAQDIQEHFRGLTILENTPIHCSIVNANRDKSVFKNPNEFSPERSDLNKIIVWNGVEEDILNKDENKRPIRYCPGHDLSLDVIQYVAEQLLPVVIEDTIRDDINKTSKKTCLSASPSKLEEEEEDYILSENDNNSKLSSSSKHDGRTSHDSEKKLILMKSYMKHQNETVDYCYSALDNYTKLVIKLMQIAVKETNSCPPRAIDITEPLDLPTHSLGIFRIEMAKFIPSWDEDIPKGTKLIRRLARWLINLNIWSFDDRFTEFNSLEQATQWRSKVFAALPLPNIVYTDMFSDQVMTQLAFASCACHYTHRVEDRWAPGNGIPDEKFLKDAVYVNDVTALSTFRVRKPFERYGAAAYFDKNFQIIAIYWSHASRLINKGDQLWEHAKYVWRSSFFANVTICDHLIAVHMIECNAFVSASRQCLPSNHPLRIFVKPFTYHAISINYQAAVSLVSRRGLVHRVWAFDYDEFLKLCDYNLMNYRFRLLPDFISKTMHPQANNRSDEEWDQIFPIYHDLNAFWQIVQDYVKEFFQINFNLSTENDSLPNDSYIKDFIDDICKQLGIAGITSLKHLSDVLAQLIAVSTGMHEHIGEVSEYLVDPRFIGTKLQEGKEIQNIQTYSQALILSVVTGLRMPGLLEDWSHLITHDQYYSDNLKNYRNFKRQLQKLSQDIDRRNQMRNYPFESFNPKYMECSTST